MRANNTLEKQRARIDGRINEMLFSTLERLAVQESPARHAALGDVFRVQQLPKQIPKTEKHGGHMFVQGMIGTRLRDADGSDIIKLSFVCYNMPNLFDQNEEIVRAVARQDPRFAELAKNMESYTEDNSLVMSLVSSNRPVQEFLSLLPAMYNATEQAVRENEQRLLSGLTGFIRKDVTTILEESEKSHEDRQSKLGKLLEDTMSILSAPEHTQKTAYRNKEILYEEDRRMELLFKSVDGKLTLMTPGPPVDNYKMFVFDENIAADEGDKKSIRAILQFLEQAYRSGATTVFGLQVNNTATVDSCGHAKKEDIFGNQTPQQLSQGIQNPLDQDNPAQYDPAGHAPLTAPSASENAGEADASQQVCNGCGRTRSLGVGICSCGSIAAHAKNKSAA